MKNICFFIPYLSFKGGIFKVVYNIANELSNNYNILFAYISCDIETKKIVEQKYNILNYKCRNKKILKYFSIIRPLSRFLNENKIDIIVVSGMELVLFAYLSTIKNKNIQCIAWEHLNFYAGPKFRLEWFGKRIACHKFAAVVNITKKDYNYYLNYENKRKININLIQIYNLTNFNNVNIDYCENSKKIMSCGYLSKIKGFDMLIDVAKNVFEKFPDWTWDIYGSGDEYQNLKNLIIENNLTNNVFLKGYDNNVQRKFREYSFFVLTSRLEGMGMVLIEAQKSKLPIISFDISCGPSDVVVNNVNGYLIAPFNINEMSDKIVELISNKNNRIKFSNNSQIKHNEFEKNIIIEKWNKLFTKVLGDDNHESQI